MVTLSSSFGPMMSLCAVLCLATACAEGIRVVGLDKDGKVKVVKVPPDEYKKNLGDTLAEAYDAALLSLPAAQDVAPESSWRLSYIRVGLGIEGKVSIADIVTVGAYPRIRLWFRRPPQPALSAKEN